MKKILIPAVIVGAAALVVLTGCVSESDTVSQNISTDAEQFKIHRQIVFYNGITDKYVAEVNGYCSIDKADGGLPSGTLAVTCKVGKNTYIKDNLGKSDNVTWFSLQTAPSKSDPYHYEVIFKPEVVIPNIQGDYSGAPNTGSGSKVKTFTPTSPTPTPSN